MRFPSVVLVALAAAASLLGCSTGGGLAATTPPASPSAPAAPSVAIGDAVDGRSFVSTAVTGRSLAPGTRVSLSFDGIHLGIAAGCNQMSGEYEIVDGVLKVGVLTSTEMGCDEPLMGQDRWVSAFLPGATARLDGDTLTLAKDDVSLTLLDEEVATPDRPLEGTRWVVTGVQEGEAVSSVPAGVTPSLTFRDGSVFAEAGCNSGSGTYQATETTIAFGAVATTKMACADAAAMAVEGAVLATLAGEVTYEIDGGTLTLRNGGSGLILDAEG